MLDIFLSLLTYVNNSYLFHRSLTQLFCSLLLFYYPPRMSSLHTLPPQWMMTLFGRYTLRLDLKCCCRAHLNICVLPKMHRVTDLTTWEFQRIYLLEILPKLEPSWFDEIRGNRWRNGMDWRNSEIIFPKLFTTEYFASGLISYYGTW